MASNANVSTDFAEKFAAKLAHALESVVAIGVLNKQSNHSKVDILRVVGAPAESAQALMTEWQGIELSEEDFSSEISRIAINSSRRILAIDASDSRDRSLWLLVSSPDASEILIDALISATRSQLERESSKDARERSLAENSPEDYTESFIEQITQDFEELTWLRQSHRFADLYSVNASSVEVAQACVASLAEVIHAENLVFLEMSGLHPQPSSDSSQLHVLAGSPLPWTAWDVEQWTQQMTDHGRKSPILLDCSRDRSLLQNLPFIRNCMLTVVAKGDRVYGWLIAINKCESDANSSYGCDCDGHPLGARFSTFEAGLLTTAANILAAQASNAELFAAQEELTKGLVLAIINAIDAKDCYTAGHSERVASFAKCIAARMGLSKKQCEQVHMAGLLHDVGKIGIPDAILKKPGKLTDKEFDAIKTHPVIGYSILRHLKRIDYVLPGVLFHHEAYNGTGYPQGLKGQDIPLMARILAVCDSFDAMTSTRPYRQALSRDEAMNILASDASKMWDVEIVQVFLECVRDELIAPCRVSGFNPSHLDSENMVAPNLNFHPSNQTLASVSGST